MDISILKELRKSKGIKLQEMSKDIGISRARLGRFESGIVNTLSVTEVCDYANRVGLELRFIVK